MAAPNGALSTVPSGGWRSLGRVFCYALVLAAAALFFCSKSSFAYPINDWCDANVYFSAGKGMLAGRVMYLDLYDHKGPLIYGLHALCAWVCPDSFTGVYGLEVLFAAAFLTVAYRLIALYGGRRLAPLALPLLALAVYTSWSFQSGDSAEELALPMLLYPVYDVLRRIRQSGGATREVAALSGAAPSGCPNRPSAALPFWDGRLALDGFLLGCVFWMKFTLCGPQGAALLLLCLFTVRDRGWRAGGKVLALLLLGFLAATLPWLLYFGANGAVGAWLKTYLYDNIFLYSQGDEPLSLLRRCFRMVKSALAWLGENPLYTVPTLLGMVWCAFGKGLTSRERLTLLLSFLLGGVGAFLPGRTYPYYALSLAAFAPVFFLPLCGGAERSMNGWTGRRGAWLTACLCVLCLGLCPALSPNVPLSLLLPKDSNVATFGLPREKTMQYQLAAAMAETPRATLLNYGFMDAGFYTAAKVAPNVKYFHQANVPLQEMLDEQERYIADGVCDYVVTRGRQPDFITDGYDLVATADSPGYWYAHVYLYRKKGLGE